MSTTDKYDLNRFDVSTTGFDTLSDDNVVTLDGIIHTYLREQVADGETISEGHVAQIISAGVRKAQDAPGRYPCNGIIASGEGDLTSGEYARIRRAGPIHNSSWSLSGSGEVWIDTVAGGVTQTKPAEDAYAKYVGTSIGAQTIVVQR